MKTLFITIFLMHAMAASTLAGSGCEHYKEVTFAEQKSSIQETLIVEVEGMELIQLTNEEGKVLFKIRNLFGEEVAQGLDREQLEEQFPKVYKALIES